MVGSIDGIVSGMDTGSIITQLMQLERMPQVRLQSKRAGVEKILAALRGVNTRCTAVHDAARALTVPKGWQLAKGTSSDATRVAVTATAGATTASLTFRVSSLASAGSVVSSGTVPTLDTVVANRSLLLAKGTAPLGIGTLDSTPTLAAGAHTLTVTQASAGATRTGATALAASTTITTGVNDAVRITVGGAPVDVVLAAGSYDRGQLAQQLTQQLGGLATASVGADGKLVLTTTAEGSAATLQVGTGGALASLGLTTDATAATGTDGRIQLDGDAAREVTVTDVRPGQTLTLFTAAGSSLTATLAGGLRSGEARVDVLGDSTGTSLSEAVSLINASGAGVTAAAVQSSPGQYRLQLTSTTAGAASDVQLGPGSLAGLGGLQTLTAGSDAVLVVGTGAGAYTVTRSSNTISDLLKGVTLTLGKADPATEVTVDVAADRAGISKQVKDLVDAANAALNEISNLTKYDPTTRKGGLLVGDGLLRRLRSELVTAVTGQVGGIAPSTVGITLQRDGTLAFDEAKLLAAYDKDPLAVQALLGAGTVDAAGLAARVQAFGKRATDRTDGLVPAAIKSKEALVRGFGERISSWDERLSLRETALRRQFTAMEKALGAAQSQGQWLAGQIAGLPSWGA